MSAEPTVVVTANVETGCLDVLATRLSLGGLWRIQAIAVRGQGFNSALRQVDFIKRYIFPGGCRPRVSVMCDNLTRHTRLVATELHDIGHDYALTLNHWRQRFHGALSRIRDLVFAERFVRTLEYYLCSC